MDQQAKSQLFLLISDVKRPVFVTIFGFATVTKIHEMKLNSLEEIDFYSTIGTQSLIRLGSLTYNMNVCTLNLIQKTTISQAQLCIVLDYRYQDQIINGHNVICGHRIKVYINSNFELQLKCNLPAILENMYISAVFYSIIQLLPNLFDSLIHPLWPRN